jgi:ferredoxin-NADP reductase
MSIVGRHLSQGTPASLRSLPPVARARRLPVANATLAGRDDVTATLAVFVVVLDGPLASYRSGQYVSLGIVDDGELVQRPYSIVSLHDNGTRVELFVRRLPNGRFSNLLWRQPLGERVFVGPAKGLFTLDPEDRRPSLLVGTGTGVAPLVAMLESAMETPPRRPIVLVHGASFADELVFQDRIVSWVADGLSVDYRPTVSRPRVPRNLTWTGRTGRVDDQLATLLNDWRWLRAGGSVAYLCGNPDMVSTSSHVLRDAGFAPVDIHTELFHAPLRTM